MIDNMNLKQSFLIQLYKCSHHTSCRTLVVWMWDPLRLCRILQWVSMLASSTGYFPQGCSTHFPRPPRRVHPVCPSIGGCICRTTWKDDHVDYESSTTSFYTLPASLSMRSASYTVTPICCRHGAEKSLQTSCTRISHDMSLSIIHDPTPGCKAGHPSSHPIGTSIGPRTTRLLDSQDLNRTWATRIEAHAWIILEHLWMSSESSVRFEDDNIPPPPFCLHKPEAETTTALRHLPFLFQVRKRQTATYALFNLDGCVIQLRSCHPCPSTGLNFWRRYWIHCSRKKEHHCPPNISAFWPPLGFFYRTRLSTRRE